ncbi:MAG: thiol reductase thioredoxin [Deltaproteobacteria bacterium]|nr:thiol reductase thioredoxin [Deltaproteobacteria bacterium]
MDKHDGYIFRCVSCGTKNRIPASKVEQAGKCGKCQSPLEIRDVFSGQTMMITDDNFSTNVLKSPLPVLLYCWAPWCSTCGMVTPTINEFAVESKGRVRVGKLNVDANPELAAKFDIRSIPFLLIFDNGQMKEGLPGGMQQHEIMMKMAPYLY